MISKTVGLLASLAGLASPAGLASLAALVSLSLLAASCGDRASSTTSTTTLPGKGGKAITQQARPKLEAEVPVLRWVPPKADLVVVVAGIENILPVAQFLSTQFPNLDLSGLGDDSWSAKLWSSLGVNTEAPAALFAVDSTVTVILPLREADKLKAWAKVQMQDGLASQSYRGREISSSPRGQLRWTWLEVKGFFVLHLSLSSQPGAGPGQNYQWLDSMLDASEGSAYSGTSVAQQAHQFRGTDALWGSLNALPVLASLVGGPEYLACTDLLGRLNELVFAGSLSREGAFFRSVMNLGKGAEAELQGLRSPSVSEGMRGQRATAGAYASIAVDLQPTGEALRRAGCSELASLVQDPLASAGWSPPPRAVHVAGTNFEPSSLSGKIALDVALRSKRFIKGMLGRIPARGFFETTIRVEGQRVKRLSIPTMSSLYYQLSNERLVFASKKSIMKGLLTPASGATEAKSEILALGFWPERLPQLRQLLRQLIRDREQREAIAYFLRDLDHAQASLHLKGARLELQVEVVPRN